MARKKETKLFVGQSSEPPLVQDDSLTVITYHNILQTVAQMRKAQNLFFRAADKGEKQKFLIESKTLEQVVDMRLGEIGIKAY